MKQFENNSLPEISPWNFANLFNVYQNKDNVWTYSLNKNIYFSNTDNLQPSNYSIYTVEENDQWTILSNTFYGTIDLWWLICKVNNINDPTTNPIVGNKIIILEFEFAQTIADQLKSL